MKLNELLKNVEVLNVLGDIEVEITGVNIDSRKIEKGHLFIAIPGTQTDGLLTRQRTMSGRLLPNSMEILPTS